MEFDLFGKKYTLEYVDNLSEENSGEACYGLTNHPKCEVKIAKKVNDTKLKKDDIEITKLHELFHCIFDAGQYNNCNDDESLVEWCARCIFSLKKQGVI